MSKYLNYILYAYLNIIFLSKTILSQSCNLHMEENLCEYLGIEDFSNPEYFDNGAFQTPPKYDIYGRYKDSYQDMAYFVGYARLNYSANKEKCTITFETRVNPKVGKEGIDYYILYKFGSEETRNKTKEFNSKNDSYPDGLSLSARVILKKVDFDLNLELEDEYFIWDNPIIIQSSEYKNGQKGAIVELFGWPYDDIKEECDFISHAGYLGLKVFCPTDHMESRDHLEGTVLNPWWYAVQIVSYKLESRYGNKTQLKKMINKCRSLNLRVYAEVTINHMTAFGNDRYDNHTYEDCSHGKGKSSSAGSPFWTNGYIMENNPYTNQKFQNEYPSVPFFPSDFHCGLEIKDWDDPILLAYGCVVGLNDINTEKEYPRQRIADFFTELISIGFSGFVITNVKHVPSFSMVQILKKFKENLGNKFPDDLLIVFLMENVNMDLVLCDLDSIINYGDNFDEYLKKEKFSKEEIYKIKFWYKGCLAEEDFIENYEPLCDYMVEIDVDRWVISLEYSDDINMAHSEYNIYIKDKNIEKHRNITIERMFKNPKYDWPIRYIFTSFSLYDGMNGIPDGKSSKAFCETDFCKENIVDIPYRKAYNPLSTGYDCGNESNWVEGEYSRIHRDIFIVNAMRNWMFPKKPDMTEEELYAKERYKILKMNCSEKCLTCDEESRENNLCLTCDKSKGFYPLINNIKNETNETQKYFECYNFSSYYDFIYFNTTEEAFKFCYKTCKTCNKEGNEETPNCILEYKENICELYDYLENKCNISGQNETKKELFVQDIIKEITSGYLDKLLSSIIEDNKDLVIQEEFETYQISTLSSQLQNTNISSVDIGNCEYILREFYNINETEELIIFKVEHFIPGFKIPIIEYSLFSQNGSIQLNLSLCNDSTIIYNLPVSINESELYKYDLSSDYYNDICYVYSSENNTDMPLSLRKRQFNNNNMSLCQTGCEFLGYNTTTKNANCECKVENNQPFDRGNFDINLLFKKFIDIKNMVNYGVMKCYKLLFSSDGLISNIGSYVIIFIIFITLMEYIMFLIEGKTKYYNEIQILINKVIKLKNSSNHNRRKNLQNISNKIEITKLILIGKHVNKKGLSITEFNEENKNESEKRNAIENEKESNVKEKENEIKEKEEKEINENMSKELIENKNDTELNSLSYEKALKYDKRTYFEYYSSLIRNKQLLILVCYTQNDYNSRMVKICLMFSSFALYYTVNALFFNDSTMNKIYEDQGKDNIAYRIPQILYSTIISTFIKTLLTTFSLTERNILEIKSQKTSKSINITAAKIFKKITKKIIIFFVMNFLILIFFWYYLSSFCAVYKNTQVYLIKDTIISFCLSLIYPFFINIVPSILRIMALKKENKLLYKVSQLTALI